MVIAAKINWTRYKGLFTRSKIRTSIFVGLALLLALLESFRKKGFEIMFQRALIWRDSPTLAYLEPEEHSIEIDERFLRKLFDNSMERYANLRGKSINKYYEEMNSKICNRIYEIISKQRRPSGLIIEFQCKSDELLIPLSLHVYSTNDISRFFLSDLLIARGLAPPEVIISISTLMKKRREFFYSREERYEGFYELQVIEKVYHVMKMFIEETFRILNNWRIKVASPRGVLTARLIQFIEWIDIAKNLELVHVLDSSVPMYRRRFLDSFTRDLRRYTVLRSEKYSNFYNIVTVFSQRMFSTIFNESKKLLHYIFTHMLNNYEMKIYTPQMKILKHPQRPNELQNAVFLYPKRRSSPITSHMNFLNKIMAIFETASENITSKGIMLMEKYKIKGFTIKEIKKLLIQTIEDTIANQKE
ncbi:MAG: hypothetical protein ACTSUJ_09205 [Candidatus Njordarchaeales archaeon]